MSKVWIGQDFQKTGLLLVGESAYCWRDKEGTLRQPGESHAIELVEGALRGDFARFTRVITQALTRSELPTAEASASAWSQVAFYNYVPGYVESAQSRPSRDQWLAGRTTFLENLKQLSPRNAVILGRELWGWLPECDIHLTNEVQIYRTRDSALCFCWAALHPSRRNWREYADLFGYLLGKDLTLPNQL